METANTGTSTSNTAILIGHKGSEFGTYSYQPYNQVNMWAGLDTATGTSYAGNVIVTGTGSGSYTTTISPYNYQNAVTWYSGLYPTNGTCNITVGYTANWSNYDFNYKTKEQLKRESRKNKLVEIFGDEL